MAPLLSSCAAVTLHLASVHLSAGDFNEFNPGVGLTCGDQVHVGVYHNSIRRVSFYAGRSWEWCHGPVCGAVALLAITGYQRPVVAPVPVLFVGRDWRLATVIAPRVADDSAAFIGFGIQKQLTGKGRD